MRCSWAVWVCALGLAACGGSAAVGDGGTGVPPGCVPDLACTLAAAAPSGDPAADCVARINQFRTQCACLPALARWTDGEACAAQQAEYDSTRTPHAGFRAGLCTSGSAQDECPGWPSVAATISGCLQQMWDEGPGPTGCASDPACYQQHGHFLNMSSTRFTKVACGWYTGPRGVWAVQNFR